MNHDATLCADYLVAKCPKRCYRAQLTQQDLRKRPDFDLRCLPISWAHFRGTEECPLSKKVSE